MTIASPCSCLTEQEQCRRGKYTSYRILVFPRGMLGIWVEFPLHPWLVCWLVTPHLLFDIILLRSRPVLYLTQQFKFHPAITHTFTLETLTAQWPHWPQIWTLLLRATGPRGWEDSLAALPEGRGGGRRPWGCSMSVAVLHRWEPHQAEPSATLWGIAQPPGNCTLRLQWVCKYFCRRLKLLAPHE